MQLTQEQIEFLDKVCKGTWKLNPNGEVDVDGNVYMGYMNITEITVKFGSVGGHFECSNNQLTSLIGSPKSIEYGDFICSHNQLTSLIGSPKSIIGGYFYCLHNNLTSLDSCPTLIEGGFGCSYNNHLTNYFKNIKEEDFLHWDKLYWGDILRKYPFLINIAKKYIKNLKVYVDRYPQTKIYLE